MTLAQQTTLAGFLPWLPVAVFAIGGLWAIRLVGRPPRLDRPDLATASRLGGLLALLAAGGVMFIFAALGGAWGGSAAAGLAASVPYAIGAAALVYLSGVAVYALLARPNVGALALVGIVAGPLLLGGLTATATRWRDQVSGARYGFLHMSIDVVEPQGVAGRSILGPVRLEVTVRSDYGFEWTVSESGRTSPRFRLAASSDSNLCGAELAAPAGSPSRFEPGEPVRYSLEFALPASSGTEPCRWESGYWWVDLLGTGLLDGDTAPESHIVQAGFQVGA